jgi:hypothetical protein
VDAQVRLVTKNRAADISWWVDDGEHYAGPTKQPVIIGGRADMAEGHSFVGSIAGLLITPSAISADKVNCMMLQGEQSIGQCTAPRTAFTASLFEAAAVSNGVATTVTTHGAAYCPRPLGAVKRP